MKISRQFDKENLQNPYQRKRTQVVGVDTGFIMSIFVNLSSSFLSLPLIDIEVLLPDLSKTKIFSVVDAKNGFWHVELDDESSYLTTFNTPFGCYRWLRMFFGISSAPEEYQRRQDQTVEGLPGVRSIGSGLRPLLVIKCPIKLTSFIFKEICLYLASDFVICNVPLKREI
jgi:hypothetical protein